MRLSLEDRFMSKVEMLPWSGCWIWTACTFKKARGVEYGQITVSNGGNGRPRQAHRVSFEIFKGQIPEGHFIDHMCRVTLCVNPAHLRAVTPRVNVRENNSSVCTINAHKTHCKHGHEFTPENTLKWPGGRACRECRRILRARIWKEQKR